jgi:hypothetical protein
MKPVPDSIPLQKMRITCFGIKTGHKTMECKENRKFDLNDIPDKVPEQAWADLKKADKERDLIDFREV